MRDSLGLGWPCAPRSRPAPPPPGPGNAVWLLGEQYQIDPDAWPADLAAIVLQAIRGAPRIDPHHLAELSLGPGSDAADTAGDDRAEDNAGVHVDAWASTSALPVVDDSAVMNGFRRGRRR